MAIACGAVGETIFTGALNPGEEPTVFAVLGDFGGTHDAAGPARVASMIKSWRPDFIVVAGDLNYGTTTLEHPDWDSRIGIRYGDFIRGRADRKYPLQVSPIQRFFPVIGNHDTIPTDQTTGSLGGGSVLGYVDYFVRNVPGFPDRLPTGSGVHDNEVSYYDFYWGDMHFIMADSDRGRVDAAFAEAQNAWIRNTLQTSTGTMKFVVCHHPAWSSDAVHTSQTWMQGEHLSMADAVFAGHAHLYERLDVDGTAFFTSGLGGQSFYPFTSPPLPQSQFRHNTSYGALRVTKNHTGALCEFLSIADGANGANGGTVIDTHALGPYVAVQNAGRHPLEVVAGQTIQIVTSLPVAPGGGANSLDPRIEVFSPDGMLVAADEDSAWDGVNAALSFEAAASGRHTIVVSPEGATSGCYQVVVNADPPAPPGPYPMWATQNFGFDADASVTGPQADPDADGRCNLFEFATGTDPRLGNPQADEVFSAPRTIQNAAYLDISLHEGIQKDISYGIQASGSLEEASWTEVATYVGGTGWTGAPSVVMSPGEGPFMSLRIAEIVPPSSARHRFYRLRVVAIAPVP